jgi:hypothetical protein
MGEFSCAWEMPKPLKKGKKMTKAKSGKVVSSLDVVNADLRASFEAVVNLEAEISVYEKAVSMLNAGTISVRGLKATIEAAQEKGALPTIKPSTAQYFALSASVRALAGGKEKALKDVLNATIQAKRAFGKDTLDRIAESKSFAELVKATPKQGERAKAGRKASPVAESVDSYVSLFMGAKDLTDFKVENVEQFNDFLNLIKRISEYNRRNHPAMKAKVSA